MLERIAMVLAVVTGVFALIGAVAVIWSELTSIRNSFLDHELEAMSNSAAQSEWIRENCETIQDVERRQIGAKKHACPLGPTLDRKRQD